jgi:hypothetical protein
MRKNAYWMKQQDDRILEYIDAEGFSSPSLIATEDSIDISEGHIEERLLMLWYAGFVAQLWSDTYELTSEGRRYLDGDLDASHQPTPTVERVLRS